MWADLKSSEDLFLRSVTESVTFSCAGVTLLPALSPLLYGLWVDLHQFAWHLSCASSGESCDSFLVYAGLCLHGRFDNVQHGAVQRSGSFVRSSVPEWVLSGFPCFFPQSKHMHGKLPFDSDLLACVCLSVRPVMATYPGVLCLE